MVVGKTERDVCTPTMCVQVARSAMKDQDQLLDLQTTDSFRLYLDEVGRHPLLTKDDEIELSQAYEAGLDAQLKLVDTSPDDPARPDLETVADRGEWARRKMIESSLRLVVSIARRFSATGLPLGDLVQEGKHRQDPPVVVLSLSQRQLGQNAPHMLLHRPLGDPQPPSDPSIGPALSHQGQYLALPVTEDSQRIITTPRPHQLG